MGIQAGKIGRAEVAKDKTLRLTAIADAINRSISVWASWWSPVPALLTTPDYGLKFARSWQFENEKREAKIDHRKNVLEMYTKSPTKTRAGYNAYINHGDLFGGSSLPRALDRPWPEYLNRFSSCRTIARRGNQFGGLKVDPLTNDAPEAAEELMRQAYARLPHHFPSTKRTAMRSLQSGVQFMTVMATKMPFIGRGWASDFSPTWSPACQQTVGHNIEYQA
jgi:hypothetical protein